MAQPEHSKLPEVSRAAQGHDVPSADQPPQLEGYRVLGRLGEGGMGTVWRAVQLSTDRQVAVKLLRSQAFSSPEVQARFAREVKLAAQLEHPNIGRVYDSGLLHGHFYYAMELVEGIALDAYARAHRLNRQQVLELMSVTCRAVAHAHRRGIVHRDLKPSNIQVTADAQPHVLDFGLAKVERHDDTRHELTLSQEGQFFGTPAFMSPEQAGGHGDRADARSDVYSLGVILYQLLAGRSPYGHCETEQELIHAILSGGVISPRQTCPDLDRSVRGVLERALALAPEDRYKDADELADAIDRCLGKTSAPAPAARRRRTRWPLAAGAVALVGIAITLVVPWRPQNRTAKEPSTWPVAATGQSGTQSIQVPVSDLAGVLAEGPALALRDRLLDPRARNVLRLTTADGRGSDASIDNLRKGLNYGTGGVMQLQRTDSHTKIGYLRFDVRDLRGRVAEAALCLTPVPPTGSASPILEVYGLNDGPGDAWGEGTGSSTTAAAAELKWADAPGLLPGGGDGMHKGQTRFLGAFSIDNRNYRIVGKQDAIALASDAMTEFLNKDTNGLVTFILVLRDRGTNLLTIATRENGKYGPPKLLLSAKAEGEKTGPSTMTRP